MFRSKTVLVVGAGASCEANFPDGRRLLNRIREMLDIRFNEFSQMHRGDREIAQALRLFVPRGEYGEDYNNLLRAAWRIRDAAVLGLSIDNIIEQHDDDEGVALCGKLAIIRAILEAEGQSFLTTIPNREDQIDIMRVAETWYGRFGQLLTENISRRRAEQVFENLRIVCFNYDRALQHYLPHSLTVSWGITLAEARELVQNLEILHPYGRVAPLRWEDGNGGIEFGHSNRGLDEHRVDQIRTYSERIEDDAALAQIRNTVAWAEQVVFLGFAFHAPNMELLRPVDPAARRVLATVYELPENEKRQIEIQIRGMFNLPPGVDGLVLHDGKCSDLIRENWRTLSAEP